MRLMEIHDRKWFPKFLRDFVTDDLETILNLVNVYQPVARRVAKCIGRCGNQPGDRFVLGRRRAVAVAVSSV